MDTATIMNALKEIERRDALQQEQLKQTFIAYQKQFSQSYLEKNAEQPIELLTQLLVQCVTSRLGIKLLSFVAENREFLEGDTLFTLEMLQSIYERIITFIDHVE
ncbi:MAG: hypothetical protein WC819_05370 [Parcubacteria group bacterium]|jgi:hypothetical protein